MLKSMSITPKSGIDPNIVYLSSSAAQKCIRRCNVEGALNFAKIMWQDNQYNAWRRMFTWFSEDCCRNIKALRLLRASSSKNFDTMIPAIREMAEGPKDKTGTWVSQLMMVKRIKPLTVWSMFKDKEPHNIIVEFARNWDERKFSLYDDYTGGVDNYKEIVDLCEFGAKFDREQFIMATPYFFIDKVRELGHRTTSGFNLNECEDFDYYDEFFPLQAMDGHTRPGLSAYSIFLKHRSFPEIRLFSSLDLKLAAFFNEGWYCRNLHPYPYPYFEKYSEHVEGNTITKNWLGYVHETTHKIMKEQVLPELQKVRTWVLDKYHKDQMKTFKWLYLENHLL